MAGFRLGRLLLLPLILAAGRPPDQPFAAGILLDWDSGIEVPQDHGSAQGEDQPRSGVRRIAGRALRSWCNASAARSTSPACMATVMRAPLPEHSGASTAQPGFDFPPPARSPPEA